MEDILNYLKSTYSPCGIIVYGSYSDGTNNANSDFDALIITENGLVTHDDSIVDGIVLDVFVYPRACIDSKDFLHIYGGKVILDIDGTASKLMTEVERLFNEFTPKTHEEKRTNIAWCEKMLLRADRNDAEGFFRWHWLLTESLEIYCDVIGQKYLGPKKSLVRMMAEDKESYCIYERALANFDYSLLSDWISHIKRLI